MDSNDVLSEFLGSSEATIVRNTAIERNTVIAYPARSPDATGNTNEKQFSTDNNITGQTMFNM